MLRLHLEVYKVLHLPRNLHFEVHQGLRLPRNLRGRQVLRLPRNLLFEVHKSAAPATKSANEPHVEKLRFTAPVTKSQLVEDHHHVQSTVPVTKAAFQSKTAPIPCTCHEKSTLDHENTRFPLHLPRIVTTICDNAHCTTTRARSLEAPAAPTQISRACAVEMRLEDSRDMNALYIAANSWSPRALQRSKHQLLFPYRKNP